MSTGEVDNANTKQTANIFLPSLFLSSKTVLPAIVLLFFAPLRLCVSAFAFE